MNTTKYCRICRWLLPSNKKLFLVQIRQFKYYTVAASSKFPTRTVDIEKHYEDLLDDFKKKKIFTSGTDNKPGKEFNLTLENVLSDANKKRVQEAMQLVKTPSRPDALNLGDRRAAVLVPLCYVGGEPSLLFMVRSLHLKYHRGEISFPGGMEDPTDADLMHTALRETFEEIGLPMDQVEVWGKMRPSPSRMSGSWVTPFLGMCGEIDINKLHLNPAEVEDVFTCTLSSICDTPNQRQTQFRHPGSKGYTLPVFLGGKYRIWGLTAIIIHQVMTVLAPGLYKFKLRHRS